MRPIATIALAAALTACGGPAPPALDGVVLFTVDTLRADQLGVYGNVTYPTPALDRLAAESLVFGRAYSQATITHPALTSMLTGVLPYRNGVVRQGGTMADGIVTLPQMLKARGLETGAFMANLCKLQEIERTAWHEGWDERYCGLDMSPDHEQWAWDEDVVTRAMEWIEAREGPYLAWVHLMDPHAEHRPPPDLWDYENDPPLPWREQYAHYNAWEEERTVPEGAERERLWNLYRAEVEGVDRQVGRFLDFLDGRPEADRVALLFSADHGEELYETWSRYDHGFSLTEGVLWVPLMLRAPGVAAGWNDEVVELLQVTPTVLEILGVGLPYELDGVSLLDDEPSRGWAYSSVTDIVVCLRDRENRFYFRNTPWPYERPEDEGAPWRADAPWFKQKQVLARYDRNRQTRFVWTNPRDPEVRRAMDEYEAEMRAFQDALGPRPDVKQIDDPEWQDQLEKLGYTPGSDA